ncbi:MAG: hypothetical protein ACD_3C00006G0017 [uncultured bacterium (gcode 4)]|uniref:Uncharacterized protein n=1 Tax=uncultured bacterium (gcode 4) TaxID=1234023 RepID=K2GZA1_9BACT|nr:MAG: hypothetical protein ACD_3C00006G0017 [uncultured bacterium (gcode 4)]
MAMQYPKDDMNNPEKNWCFWLTKDSIWRFDKHSLIFPMIIRAWAEPVKTSIELFSRENEPEKRREMIERMNQRIWRSKDEIKKILNLSRTQTL